MNWNMSFFQGIAYFSTIEQKKTESESENVLTEFQLFQVWNFKYSVNTVMNLS